jgi:hypothetical protein
MTRTIHKRRSLPHAALFAAGALGGLATGMSLGFFIWNLI